ncbi:unnamed protein product [Meganyctiphanes norvegica]|uniref:Uncharacterized protein n=1 Tax=Meganyctiphanes norvegica TaxID=48144 RepID=A0AAV2QEJ5_MEGNR
MPGSSMSKRFKCIPWLFVILITGICSQYQCIPCCLSPLDIIPIGIIIQVVYSHYGIFGKQFTQQVNVLPLPLCFVENVAIPALNMVIGTDDTLTNIYGNIPSVLCRSICIEKPILGVSHRLQPRRT